MGRPGPVAWQRAIDGLGLELVIDPELKPFEDSGFLPCKLAGSESGFEIYYDGVKELAET